MGKFFTMRYQGGAAAVAAPSITYASSDVTWYDGVPITPLTVTNTGGAVTSYSVSPALPTGVSLNTSTGEISGTPTALDADDTYTITATGPGGNDTFDLTAEVLASLLTGLVAYWNLDEASGTREDSHTNGLDLTDNNTVGSGLGVDGSSTAADFVAANSELLSRASEAALQAGDIDFSFSGWVYLNAVGADRSFVTKKINNANVEYRLRYNSASNQILFQVNDGGSTVIGQVAATGAPSTGTWYFIYAYHSATDNQVGIQVNAGTTNTVATSGAAGTNTAAFRLGAENTTATLFHDGRMQSWGYWKRLLTSDERTWLYNSGSAARAYSEVAAYEP